MKRILFIITVVLVVLSLSACQSTIVGDGVTGAVVGAVDYGETKEEAYADGTIEVKEFAVRVTKEGFDPKILSVDKGDPVRLILYPSDTDHGFVLPAYGINEHLEEDNYKTIEFIADADGEYTFFSNVYSGPNTKNMYGTLLVSVVE
jgi:heme/copper-type cytochrome/quinol oxidase subunit 2